VLLFVVLLPPTLCSLAHSPSCCLDTVPSKLLHAHLNITKSPPDRLFGRRQNHRSGQPRCALHLTDRHHIGTLLHALDRLVFLLLCTLFFHYYSTPMLADTPFCLHSRQFPISLTSCSSVQNVTEFYFPPLLSSRTNSQGFLFHFGFIFLLDDLECSTTPLCRLTPTLILLSSCSRPPSPCYLSIHLASCPCPSRTSRLSHQCGSYDSHLISRSTGPPQIHFISPIGLKLRRTHKKRRLVPSLLQWIK